MTIVELEKRINEFKKLKEHATGLKKSEIIEIIDDLETQKLELTFEALSAIQVPEGLTNELENITNHFSNAADQIENATNLLDRSIELGKKLLQIIT